MSLIELARYFTAIEAEIERTKLLSFGIETVVFDGAMNIADGANLNARLMVLPEDYDEALTIISSDEGCVTASETKDGGINSPPNRGKWQVWNLFGGW